MQVAGLADFYDEDELLILSFILQPWTFKGCKAGKSSHRDDSGSVAVPGEATQNAEEVFDWTRSVSIGTTSYSLQIKIILFFIRVVLCLQVSDHHTIIIYMIFITTAALRLVITSD